MDLARSWDSMDRVATDIALLPAFFHQISLEVLGFDSAEIVVITHDVAPVGVNIGIEIGEERKHLCCVPAAAEYDEEVDRHAALAGW